jgi:hypothetical protein
MAQGMQGSQGAPWAMGAHAALYWRMRTLLLFYLLLLLFQHNRFINQEAHGKLPGSLP